MILCVQSVAVCSVQAAQRDKLTLSSSVSRDELTGIREFKQSRASQEISNCLQPVEDWVLNMSFESTHGTPEGHFIPQSCWRKQFHVEPDISTRDVVGT